MRDWSLASHTKYDCLERLVSEIAHQLHWYSQIKSILLIIIINVTTYFTGSYSNVLNNTIALLLTEVIADEKYNTGTPEITTYTIFELVCPFDHRMTSPTFRSYQVDKHSNRQSSKHTLPKTILPTSESVTKPAYSVRIPLSGGRRWTGHVDRSAPSSCLTWTHLTIDFHLTRQVR